MSNMLKKFEIQNNLLTLENNLVYKIKEIDKSTLEKSIGVIDVNKNAIDNKAGVYIFVLEKELPFFNKNLFNREVTGIFFDNFCPVIKTMGVPPFKSKPKKDCVFYVGSAGQICSRLKEHWNNNKINNCVSLKLGFNSRKYVKKYLKVYVILSTENNNMNYKQVEKDIRNEYGAAFGK